jgi:hypothetical protein
MQELNIIPHRIQKNYNLKLKIINNIKQKINKININKHIQEISYIVSERKNHQKARNVTFNLTF